MIESEYESRDSSPPDEVPGRRGPWMHTDSGLRFFPQDPRVEEMCMNDIANGLALDCRYAGQGRPDRFYSVAEHCTHLANYILAGRAPGMGWEAAAVALLHDAAEAYINDVNRATKAALAPCYKRVENHVQAVIDERYGLIEAARRYAAEIKVLDQRIVPLEKDAIMRRPQEWAFDQFEPLEGVRILCLSPPEAKNFFACAYLRIADALGWNVEEIYL